MNKLEAAATASASAAIDTCCAALISEALFAPHTAAMKK